MDESKDEFENEQRLMKKQEKIRKLMNRPVQNPPGRWTKTRRGRMVYRVKPRFVEET